VVAVGMIYCQWEGERDLRGREAFPQGPRHLVRAQPRRSASQHSVAACGEGRSLLLHVRARTRRHFMGLLWRPCVP